MDSNRTEMPTEPINVLDMLHRNLQTIQGINRITLTDLEFSHLMAVIADSKLSGRMQHLFAPITPRPASAAPTHGFFAVFSGDVFWIDKPTLSLALDVTAKGKAHVRKECPCIGQFNGPDQILFTNPCKAAA